MRKLRGCWVCADREFGVCAYGAPTWCDDLLGTKAIEGGRGGSNLTRLFDQAVYPLHFRTVVQPISACNPHKRELAEITAQDPLLAIKDPKNV